MSETLALNTVDRRWFRWAFAAWLFVVVCQILVHLFVVHDNWRHAGVSGSDGRAYYAFVRSVAFDQDLDFRNEFGPLNYEGHGREALLSLPRSPHTGLLFNRYPVGYALFMTPLFLMAHVAALLAANWTGMPPDGYGLIYQFAAILNNLLWGALAWWSTHRILRRFFDAAASALATLVLFLAFQGAFPLIAFPSNPHMASLFVFNLSVLLALHIEEAPEQLSLWATLGVCIGLGGLLRTESLALAIYPAALWLALFGAIGSRRRRLASGFVCAGAACLAFLPQLLVWRLMWGRWFEVPMTGPGEGFNWTQPVLLKVLFSTRHGLFYWSPVLLAGLVGFVCLSISGRSSRAVRLLWVPLLALYYVFSCWKVWWMGYSFGARQFLVMMVVFALGCGWVAERGLRRPWILGIVAGLLVCWNQVMLWLFLNGHIPRSEGFTPLLPLQKAAYLAMRALGLGD